MSMDLAKKTFSTQPDYLIAGTAEIVTAAKEAAAALKRGAPVVLDGSGKLAAVTAVSYTHLDVYKRQCVWPAYAEGNKVLCPFQRCVRKEYERLWLERKEEHEKEKDH